MANNPKKTHEHMFSIQLKSIDGLKSVALPNDEEGTILLEGFLGMLETVNFTEDIMLEIKGSNGSLRMDLTKKELKSLLPKKRPSGSKKQI
jgi:hypothetical protein